MKVYVLIPTRNRREIAIRCLVSLKKQSYKNVDVVFIDDGSTDATTEGLRAVDLGVTILQGDGDLWWTGAMRMGVDYILKNAGGEDFVVLQNDDTYMKPDYLETLINESIRNGRMILGTPNVDLESNQLIHNAHRLGKLGGFAPTITISKQDIIETDTLSGRGVIIPIEVFRKIGNFSKFFPHYAADYDFFCRAKRAKFKIAVTSKIATYSTSRQPSFSKRIKAKKPPTFRDGVDLFFHKRSSDNLWSTTWIMLLYAPWKYKLYGLVLRYLFVVKFFFYDYLLGNARGLFFPSKDDSVNHQV